MNSIQRIISVVARLGPRPGQLVGIHAAWLVPAMLGVLLMLVLTWRVSVLHADAVSEAKALVRAGQRAQLSEAKEALIGRLVWPLRDVQYLATQQTLQRYVANAHQKNRWLDLNESLFSWMRTRQGIYAQARYMDSTGQEVVRVDNRQGQILMIGGVDLQNKAARYYFQAANALPAGEVYL